MPEADGQTMPVAARSLLSVETARDEGNYVVALQGDLDFASAALVDAELRRAEQSGAPGIVLDMSALNFIDGSGVRVVLRALARARRVRVQMGIVPGPHPVQRVFHLTGTASKLPLVQPAS